MDYAHLLQQVQRWTGLATTEAASRALDATVAALATCLPLPDRARWANCLPPELHDAWLLASYRAGQTAAAVLAQVPAAEGVSQPYALEHAQAVIRVLAESLAPEDRDVLARHVPDEFATLIREPGLREGPAATGGEARDSTPPQRDTTLASGRPGSRTPLSTAHPVGTRK
ncbi:MAG TPA: DUF2267 domain-containing protein [Polyangiales bacterium]|nr:DUF2267 domain-containing protein [Polyangiales bacterium]